MTVLNVGLIGCGNISTIYLQNLPTMRGVKVVACADLNREAAERRAKEFGIEARSVDALLASPDIDIVLNLTVPAAHAEISLRALAAGKHIYSEKPLATAMADGARIVAQAKRRGLKAGVAPDTVLGAGMRLSRRLIDEGCIGRVVTGTAMILSHGMEHWHPDPQFFFKPGAGPVFDMGPYYIAALVNLLGPVKRVGAMTAIGAAERTVTAEGPKTGSRITVETPTTALALLEMEQGALIVLGASWDVWRHDHVPIELHGLEGSMRVPDPNFFGGAVEVTERNGAWQSVDSGGLAFGAINWPFGEPKHANYRGLGVAELAAAVSSGGEHRSSAAAGQHVLDVMQAILDSGASGRFIDMPASSRPPALSEDEAGALARPL